MRKNQITLFILIILKFSILLAVIPEQKEVLIPTGSWTIQDLYNGLTPESGTEIYNSSALDVRSRTLYKYTSEDVNEPDTDFKDYIYKSAQIKLTVYNPTTYTSLDKIKVYLNSDVTYSLNFFNTMTNGDLIGTYSLPDIMSNDGTIYIDITDQDIDEFIEDVLLVNNNTSNNLYISCMANNESRTIRMYVYAKLVILYEVKEYSKIRSKYINNLGNQYNIENVNIEIKKSSLAWENADMVVSGDTYEIDKFNNENYDLRVASTSPILVNDNGVSYNVYHWNWNNNKPDFNFIIEDQDIQQDVFYSLYRKKENIILREGVSEIKDPWRVTTGYTQPNTWQDISTQSQISVFTGVVDNFTTDGHYVIKADQLIDNQDGTYKVFNQWSSNCSSDIVSPSSLETNVDFVASDTIEIDYYNVSCANSYLHVAEGKLYLKPNSGGPRINATTTAFQECSGITSSIPSGLTVLSPYSETNGYEIEISDHVNLSLSYTDVSSTVDHKFEIRAGETLTVPEGANITCASGFEIELAGNLSIDGSNSAIEIQGSGKETTFDSLSVRPPVPNTSLIKVTSNSAQLSIKDATISDYSCAIRIRDDIDSPSITVENSVIDDCNIGIKLNKLNDQDIEITNTVFSNSHNGIVFGSQMYNADQESNVEISFCTFSNIEDFGIFMFQESSTNSNSTINLYTHNNTFYNVDNVFYNGELTAITPGSFNIWSNNNIFCNSKCLDGTNLDPTLLTESYNLLYNVTGSAYFDDSNNITQSPAFTDASNGDFSLQLSSPAIDSGDEIFPVLGDEYSTDEDGTVPDRGAIPYNFPGLAGTRSGTIIIDKDTTIASGYTATLVSGSILRFNSGCELNVDGTLEANSVTFRPNATTTSQTYWDGIEGSSGSDIDLRNCTIRNATRGVETYSGIAYLDNCDIDSCDYGGYLHTPSSGSQVKNCDFDYNDDGLKILYNTNYLVLMNNTFTNNDSWALYLYQSNTNLYGNTINNNEDGIYSWRSNGAYLENTITNSTDDGIAFSQYASVDMNMEWEVESDKPENNIITGHGDDGIIVTASAAPDLGTANTMIPMELIEAGFNIIDNNGGLDVYRTSTGANVNAQGNDWGVSANVSSGVTTGPDYETLEPDGFYKKLSSSIELVSYDNPLNSGFKLESDSSFTEAITFYENYISNNSDDSNAIQAVVRLAGCYFKLETPLYNMINELKNIHSLYENTKAGNTAKHYLAGLYVCQGEYNKAIQCNSEMINTFVENNDAEMAANAYMDGVILCETIPENENSLNKSTLQNNKEAYITELLEKYPNSEATNTICKMYSLPLPEITIPNEYKLYNCYPNPFNPMTTISFDLPISGNIILELFNVRGQLVKTIINGTYNAGHYEKIIDCSDLGSGIYIYKLTSADYTAVNRMTLLK